MVFCQLNSGIEPVFSFSVGAIDMNVHAIFFPGKKEESVPAFAKYCGAHRLALDIDSFCEDRERSVSDESGQYVRKPQVRARSASDLYLAHDNPHKRQSANANPN